MFKPTQKSKLREIVLVIFCIYAIYFYLNTSGIFDIPRLKTNDIFLRISRKLKSPPPIINKLTIVTIDDESYARLNQRWPWKRDTFAVFLQKLKTYNPKFICLDFVFAGTATSEEDKALSDTIKEAGNIFLPSYVSSTAEHVTPQKIFSEAAIGYGFIEKPLDKDNSIRRFFPVRLAETLTGKSEIQEPSLELTVLAKYFDMPIDNAYIQKQSLLLKSKDKEILLPIKKDMSMLINYSAFQKQFHCIPFWRIIEGKVNKEDFSDKIVIVGETGDILHDIHITPFGLMAGPIILTNTLLTLLSGDFIKELSPIVNFLIFIVLGLSTGIATHRLSLLKGLAFVITQILGFILFGIYLNFRNWQLDTFSPVLVILATYGATGLYEYICLLKEMASLQTLAITDGLTGLFAYRYFQIRLQYEFDRVHRYGGELSLIILDVDHFKNFNDTYGHESGNTVLKSISDTLRVSIRKIDILARYGGEEFCVILPHINLEGALAFSDRLREIIEQLEVKLTKDKNVHVTVSIGVASLIKDKTNSTIDLIENADKALYEAKEKGRNRVCAFQVGP